MENSSETLLVFENKIGFGMSSYCALSLFYEIFNYYPPMKEDTPYRRTVQIWNTLINQRVTACTTG